MSNPKQNDGCLITIIMVIIAIIVMAIVENNTGTPRILDSKVQCEIEQENGKYYVQEYYYEKTPSGWQKYATSRRSN